MTQEFFARLLQRNWVAIADPSNGRFRSFLLMVLNRFLANEWDKVRAGITWLEEGRLQTRK